MLKIKIIKRLNIMTKKNKNEKKTRYRKLKQNY